jgi:FAD/FMN-containing dehydrogenase
VHLRHAGARSIRSAREAAERDRLWQGRKKTFGALGRLSSDLVVQDAVVPRSALPDVLDAISEIAARYGVTVGNVFHAGDGNLHPNITFDRHDPEQRGRVQRAAADMMRVCIAAGGTITGEHGVGVDKLRYMHELFDPSTLGAMRAVRRVFDPAERANPGKVIPVRSCREWSGSVGRQTDEPITLVAAGEPGT